MDMKKTKILCTIGPVSTSVKVLQKMRRAGMNGVRINTAFGNFDLYEKRIRNIRKVGDIPILIDLKGPGIRVKLSKTMVLKRDDVIKAGNANPLKFSYNIYGQLKQGERILIDDGKICLKVVDNADDYAKLLVERGGRVEDGKGVNIPGKRLMVPSISEKDLKAIEFARDHDIEFVALSFVRGKEDLTNLKGFAYNLQAEIIAKIENHQGVENFEEILKEADGVMIARGDLGVEMDLERIPLIQKNMIQKCNQDGKLAIVATEMLDSMINNPLPTRAEVSDVANAILDGADALLLSGETTIGKYPIGTVSMVSKIATGIERSTRTRVKEEKFRNISSTISRSIWQIAESMPLNKVITMTRTGYTAKVITRFKLRQPIVAVTSDRIVKNQLELYYGVEPIQFEYEKKRDRVLSVAQMLCSKGILDKEETVLFTAGIRTSKMHASNLIEIHTIKELLEFGAAQ